MGSRSREGQGLIQGVGFQGTGKTRGPSRAAVSCSIVSLFVTPWTSPPGSSVHGTVRTGILKQVAISSSRGSSQSRDRTCISCIAGRFFTAEPVSQPAVIKGGRPPPPGGWSNKGVSGRSRIPEWVSCGWNRVALPTSAFCSHSSASYRQDLTDVHWQGSSTRSFQTSRLYSTRELLEAQVGQSGSGHRPPSHVAWRTPSVHKSLTRHRGNVASAAAGGALGAGLNCRRPGRGVRDVLTCGSDVCLHRPKMSD